MGSDSRFFRVLRIFGLSYDTVAKDLSEIISDKEIELVTEENPPFLDLVFKSRTSQELVGEVSEKSAEAIGGEYIYSIRAGQTLPQAVHSMLNKKELSIAVAESCTGGLLSSMFTSLPGCSAYFLGGVVAYSNDVKQELLDVPEDILEAHGAVSSQIAEAMSYGVQHKFSSDLAVSTTGIAGPGGGSREKPVGTFHIGITYKGETQSIRYLYPADRNEVQKYAACTALDSIRRVLLGLSLRDDYR